MQLLAFVAGGVGACLAAERLTPGWDEPFVFFFVGGFLGLFLVRYWMMALSSLAGTLVMAYSGLWLLDGLGKLDAVAWAAARPVLLDWGCGGVTLLGLLRTVVAGGAPPVWGGGGGGRGGQGPAPPLAAVGAGPPRPGPRGPPRRLNPLPLPAVSARGRLPTGLGRGPIP